MKKYFDEWGWLVALVALALFVLRMLWGRSAFCGPETEQCLREWISASAGWLAVFAAVPTVYLLSKQIRDAQRQHQQIAQISLQRPMALAKRVQGETRTIMFFCEDTVRKIGGHSPSPMNQVEYLDAVRWVKRIKTIIDRKTLSRFEDEIDTPSQINLANVLSELSDLDETLSDVLSNYTDAEVAVLSEYQARQFRTKLLTVNSYMRACSELAENFVMKATLIMEGK